MAKTIALSASCHDNGSLLFSKATFIFITNERLRNTIYVSGPDMVHTKLTDNHAGMCAGTHKYTHKNACESALVRMHSHTHTHTHAHTHKHTGTILMHGHMHMYYDTQIHIYCL